MKTDQDSAILIAMEIIKNAIGLVQDFPLPGVLFRDITPLLADPKAFEACMHIFRDRYRERHIDAVMGIEARGFIFGSVLAHMLHIPFILVRKHKKLPGETLTVEYKKEYGTDTVEMQTHALKPGQKVIIIDDLIGTGGSAEAAIHLAKMAKADVIEVACVIELTELGGRERLSVPLFSILKE